MCPTNDHDTTVDSIRMHPYGPGHVFFSRGSAPRGPWARLDYQGRIRMIHTGLYHTGLYGCCEHCGQDCYHSQPVKNRDLTRLIEL